MCSESTPIQVVDFLNDLYSKFDRIILGKDIKIRKELDSYVISNQGFI